MAGLSYYTIAGRQVGSHHIAMAWLGTLFGGVWYATSGPKKTSATATPPIQASSSDEADFIKKFMEEQEKQEKNGMADVTDPGLVAVAASDLGQDAGAVPASGKERHSLTLDQRRALRRWANSQATRPSHKTCIEWFLAQYGQQISQSTVSHSLSPKYSRLDGDKPQLSGSRLRFGNWPDVEKLVLLWFQQVQASGRQPTNEELGDKAKSIFNQLPRYRDENPPEFSPGWIHRFKKRYGLLVRRQRRHGDNDMNPADDIDYLADCVPRVMVVQADTSPAAIREHVMRLVGVEASLNICALVRDEVLRREAATQQQQQQQQQQHCPPSVAHLAPPSDAASPPPPPPPPLPPPDQQQQQQQQQPSMYADDDPEVVLQNALRQLQQEEQAAEEQAAAVREERERQERADMHAAAIMATPAARASSDPRYTTPAPEMGTELTLTPIHSEGPVAPHDRPLRCPFCVNQRMLRTIREAVEHMSTHVVV
ncbi:hypothetical protein L249_2881 [Ophiocordyceps polyrhachis-furcata BCC 54312]|uniref:HTH CENPB-type domain-containing protein n=1 Tax=Ophiocordyceps polyrhachis-furcata BCC 54312 TaxID=1330021 RepID=A0A367LR17_9HYPO|nr:hypothetical protein L249_2881 [Ophiocordyceps polyrhachis-furcata BCC 54312]